MRILILTQYFPPEPALKFADLARGLQEHGHEVQVVTGFPCYPRGKLYSGFRQKLFSEEVIDGVCVTRIPQFPDHSRSALRRAWYYLSFALSAITIGLWHARKADVILVYQSALPIGLAAWVISRIKRTPYVLDVVDLWPESITASGMMRNEFALGIIRRLVKFVYHGATRINVITNGYWNNLVALGVPAEKLSLIHCWPGSGYFGPQPRDAEFGRDNNLVNGFNILYAGAIGPVQDLRVVIDAALQLNDLPEVQFVMIGDGVEQVELAELARLRGATSVRFLGSKTPQELQRYYPWADALLAHLKTDPMSRISIPSKTFAYMSAGRPILMAVEGESSHLVEMHECGLAVPPSNPQALANAIRALYRMSPLERDHMAECSSKAYEENYKSDRQISKFENLLLNVVSSGRENSCSKSLYRRHGKRILDITLSAAALVLLSPVLIVLALLVRLKLGSPILFRQLRPGVNGRLFELVKFRSMREVVDSKGYVLSDEERITPFGQFLRSTSLDELPELWNVIRGDMSLVGPRPLLVEYMNRYDKHQARRHEVRPGLTGLAQVNGRNAISWEEKFNFDIQYIETHSFLIDAQILGQTVHKVLRRADISPQGYATMPEFKGEIKSRKDDRLAA